MRHYTINLFKAFRFGKAYRDVRQILIKKVPHRMKQFTFALSAYYPSPPRLIQEKHAIEQRQRHQPGDDAHQHQIHERETGNPVPVDR